MKILVPFLSPIKDLISGEAGLQVNMLLGIDCKFGCLIIVMMLVYILKYKLRVAVILYIWYNYDLIVNWAENQFFFSELLPNFFDNVLYFDLVKLALQLFSFMLLSNLIR